MKYQLTLAGITVAACAMIFSASYAIDQAELNHAALMDRCAAALASELNDAFHVPEHQRAWMLGFYRRQCIEHNGR